MLETQLLFQVVDVGAACSKVAVIHDLLLQGNVGIDPIYDHLGQGDLHPSQCAVAAVAVGDQLANHGVIIWRDCVTVVDMGVDSDTGPSGKV